MPIARRPPRIPPDPATRSRSRLHYVRDDAPGIRRRRCGRGFAYTDACGQPVRDAGTLDRIRRLAIPPAYRDVWICADPLGHLQATGRDARGRKQYRYHPDWRERNEHSKFARMIAFGSALPRLRRQLRADLGREALPRDKVLALAVQVLADTLLRVGSREYVRANGSYGLTTLRDRHLRIERDHARFRFRAKRGQTCDVQVDDPRLVQLLQRCQRLPGQALFQFVDDDGSVHPVDSGMLNDYLRTAMAGEFSAKDFRTWGATLAALLAFATTPLPRRTGQRALARRENDVVARIAAVLRNTPTVCRRSYIHPAVFALWRDGTLHRLTRRASCASRRDCERFALRALRRASAV